MENKNYITLIQNDLDGVRTDRAITFDLKTKQKVNSCKDFIGEHNLSDNEAIKIIETEFKMVDYKIIGTEHAVDTIAIIIENDSIKIPLIDRLFSPLGVALPGGFVDKDESNYDAAKREFKEELGVEINNDFFFSTRLWGPRDDASGELYDARGEVTTQAFVCHIDSNTTNKSCVNENTKCFHNKFIAGDDAKDYSIIEIKFDNNSSREEMQKLFEEEVSKIPFAMERHKGLVLESSNSIVNKYFEINCLDLNSLDI